MWPHTHIHIFIIYCKYIKPKNLFYFFYFLYAWHVENGKGGSEKIIWFCVKNIFFFLFPLISTTKYLKNLVLLAKVR